MTDAPRADPAAAERRVPEVVAAAPLALLQFDIAGKVRLAIGAALEVSPRQLVGRAIDDLAESPERVAWLRRALSGEQSSEVTRRRGRSWRVQYLPLRSASEALMSMAAVFTGTTARTGGGSASRAEDAHLRAAVHATAEALFVVDPQGRITFANARCSQLFGSPVLLGAELRDLLDTPTADAMEHLLGRSATGAQDQHELAINRADGTTVWLLVSASAIRGFDGELLGSVALLTDISRLKSHERRLESAALIDPLTGVANRAALADRMSHALARRAAGVVAVLFCDLDNLKTTNDSHGHAAGDLLLRHVASRISATLRPADTIARYGGDEFVVVCEDLHSPREAVELAERIRLSVTQAEPGLRDATISIGVAIAGPRSDPDQLLAAADGAAYSAKRAGRNRVHLSA